MTSTQDVSPKRIWTKLLIAVGIIECIITSFHLSGGRGDITDFLASTAGTILFPAIFAAILAGVPAWILKLLRRRIVWPTEIIFSVLFFLLSSMSFLGALYEAGLI